MFVAEVTLGLSEFDPGPHYGDLPKTLSLT